MIVARAFGLAGLALVGGVSLLWERPWDGRIALDDRQPFSKGQYLAYAQPWGAEKEPWLKHWIGHADQIQVDSAHFPDGTRIAWRWPFFAPRHGGPWGYDFLAYGAYDGGGAEARVPPLRVSAIRELRQDFAWELGTGLGAANVLTEFYLRSKPSDSEAKVLEVGWLLHAPADTIRFMAKGKQIGSYVDAKGARWQVALNERYCTFVPADHGDLPTGSIDMLAALHWLRGKGLVTGDEWFTGVAIGVEPLSGFGSARVDHWAVTYR